MGWYRAGTVAVTNGSTAVIGTGTAFIANARVGDGFRGPDGAWYEINNIASDTALSIATNYLGPSLGSGIYAVMPVQGYNKDSADQLRAATKVIATIPETKQDKNNNLTALSSLVGAADRLPYFTGAGALSLAVITSKARALLARSDTAGMQAELALVPATSLTDRTAGRLLIPGWLGLGDALPITPGQDYNTLTQPGEYFYGSGTAPTNAPIVPAHLISVKGRGLYPYQEVRPIYGNALWQRSAKVANPTAAAADWNGWVPYVTGFNMTNDPQSDAGGVISSAVVSGFRVEKFANGTMCVTGKVALASQAANSFGYQTLTLPVTFLNTANMMPGLTCNAQFTGDSYGVVFQRAASTSSILYAVRNGATAQAFEINVSVRGTWK